MLRKIWRGFGINAKSSCRRRGPTRPPTLVKWLPMVVCRRMPCVTQMLLMCHCIHFLNKVLLSFVKKYTSIANSLARARSWKRLCCTSSVRTSHEASSSYFQKMDLLLRQILKELTKAITFMQWFGTWQFFMPPDTILLSKSCINKLQSDTLHWH